MSRDDIHLDAVLRHLGAAYYDSLQGKASRADVNRALDTVAEHLSDEPHRGGPVRPARAGGPWGDVRDRDRYRSLRWTRRVRDVMTTSVVTVDRITPYKEITRLLAEHRISGVPVLILGRHVAGVVSQADLVIAESEDVRRARMSGRRHPRWPAKRPPHGGLTAEDLMTSPAVTIHPDATLPGAARVMKEHRIQRLPVVDPDGKLVGIVSRRDLLSVFLRPDADIARGVRELLADVACGDPDGFRFTVRQGVVTLTGVPSEPADADLTGLAVRLIWNLDGVVDVVTRIATPKGPVPVAAENG